MDYEMITPRTEPNYDEINVHVYDEANQNSHKTQENLRSAATAMVKSRWRIVFYIFVIVITAGVSAVTGYYTRQKLMTKEPKARSCQYLFTANYGSVIYTINQDKSNDLRVKCEMGVDGGRWTVIQHRFDGSVDFQKTWEEYKMGFGNISGEFWIGNELVHNLTSSGEFELRVDISDWEGSSWYAVYRTFKVGDENSQYKLTIGDYSGTAGDSMAKHNGMRFSTVDRDNDPSSLHCSKTRGGNGGWWYNRCDYANLNGMYGKDMRENGTEWNAARGNTGTMKYTRMMIRKI